MTPYKLFAIVLMIITLVGQAGCVGTIQKNMGRFEPSTTATRNFESFTVNKDYQYFLTGADVYPVAVFGLHKDYIIDGDEELWKKIEPKEEVITELVTNIQDRMLQCCLDRPHGFDILDNHGKKIGEWYSMLNIIIGIRMKEDHKVIIYPPSDTIDLKRYQGRTGRR